VYHDADAPHLVGKSASLGGQSASLGGQSASIGGQSASLGGQSASLGGQNTHTPKISKNMLKNKHLTLLTFQWLTLGRF